MVMSTQGIIEDTQGPELSPFGLLGPATKVIEDNTERWIGGFTYPTLDGGASISLAPISGGTASATNVITPDAGDTQAYSFYYPFDIKETLSVSTFGTTPEEIYANAEMILDAVVQKSVEIELWTGTVAKGLTSKNLNRYFGGIAGTDYIDVTPTPGTAVRPNLGAALLEQALGGSTIGSRGIIHAPRAAASLIDFSHQKDDTLQTRIGTPIIAGTGYSLTNPDGTPTAPGKAWMYATGPVTVRLGQLHVLPGAVSEAVDTRINTITYYIDRPAAVTWSTDDLFAVLVDLYL